MRMIYANYICNEGQINIRHKDGWLVIWWGATPHEVLDVRRHTLGYVSQFLRVIPRVGTLDIGRRTLDRNRGGKRNGN